MTPPKEIPASLRRPAEGITGIDDSEPSVPGWSRKRVAPVLLRVDGEYLTFEQLREQVKAQAAAYRGAGSPCADARKITPKPDQSLGQSPTPESENSYPLGNRSGISPSHYTFDEETGELLPCRSLETTATKNLPGPKKKVANTLTENIRYLCETHGIEHVAFFTLTFAEHITDGKEAQRRLHSLQSGVLNERYPHRIRVFERQKSGRIHYHFVVVVPDDIRTGVDPVAIANGDYKTANKALKREWAFWHKTCKKYGFGRHNLQPVKSSHDALALYIGKYIGKGFQFRDERDKGVRLVSYSGDARHMTCKHSSMEKYPKLWRAKVYTFVMQMAQAKPHARIRDMDDLAFHLGKRWAYTWRDYILALPPADLSIPF
jgi:coenzyme F420-reducing hydrogenase delta subunit